MGRFLITQQALRTKSAWNEPASSPVVRRKGGNGMNGYLTDEELNLFIEQLERQKLYAPPHMKEQILNQAFPEKTVEALPKSGGGERTIAFFSYRLKIIAGMAAAVFMLAALPVQEKEGGYEGTAGEQSRAEWLKEEALKDKDRIDINYMLNEGTRRANQEINSWFNKISNWQEKNFYQKDGGIYYEN
ncbi:MAG: hypothetical protein NC400_13595 [Clostridium sp.]|nr:hypothetical protein [Clostridium sp.]